MKLTPKIKLLIIVSLGILTIFLIIFFIILPQQKKIVALGNDIYDQRVNYEFITQQRQDLVLLERQIKEIEENRDKVASALFTQQETLELITVLENIAKEYGIENQNLELSNPLAVPSGLFVSTINITFTSTYSDIINWALTVEEQPFYLIINSINLTNTTSQDNEENGNIGVQISAKIYWQ